VQLHKLNDALCRIEQSEGVHAASGNKPLN